MVDPSHSTPSWVLIIIALIGAAGVVLAAVLSQSQRSAIPTSIVNAITASPRETVISPQACVVPQVERLDQGAAEAALAQLGLHTVKSIQYNAEVAPGLILSQDPPAGKKLTPCQGDVVIVVSLGSSPTPFPTPTATPPPSVPTPNPYLIPFALQDAPNTLNPALGWQPGSSPANAYNLTLAPNALTLIAGPDTFPGTPMMIYSYEGDFVAQVKIVASLMYKFQGVGLVVKPADAQFNDPYWFPADWVLAGMHFGDTQHIVCYNSNSTAGYASDTAYVRVERKGSLLSCAYSTNGKNWVNLKSNLVLKLPNKVDISLYAYSTRNPEGTVAQFYDFMVTSQ